MKNHTNQELREMSLDDAVAELQNAVYAATSLIERLEYCGIKRIRGNGHHLRQEISEFCAKVLTENWGG